MTRAQDNTVMVASLHPHLGDVRKSTLEAAGYRVISISSIPEVEKGCKENRIDLVVIGYSLPPAEKRRVCVAVREHCKTPILELYENGEPELVESGRIYSHRSHTPEDFLEAVSAILRPSQKE